MTKRLHHLAMCEDCEDDTVAPLRESLYAKLLSKTENAKEEPPIFGRPVYSMHDSCVECEGPNLESNSHRVLLHREREREKKR